MIHFFLIFIGLSQLLNTLMGGWVNEYIARDASDT